MRSQSQKTWILKKTISFYTEMDPEIVTITKR